MSNLLHVTDANFKTEVLDHPGLVLVDFFADWCGPCRMLTPIIEALAEKYAGRVKIVKCNVDEAMNTAGGYGIMSIPTILLVQQGKIVDQQVGVLPADRLSALLDQHLTTK